MRTSETLGEFAKALAKAQGKFGPIVKKKKAELGKGGKYSYADMSDVCEEIVPVLSECGIAAIQGSSADAPGFLETRLVHESGEWIATDTQMFEGRNGGAQGYGSGMTYARRYGLLAAVGAAPEDDGGKASSGPAAQESGRKHNPFSTSEAWVDAVKDSLPEGYTARDFAEACEAQIRKDFDARSSARGVNSAWQKRERIIEWLAEKHSDLHANLLDKFSARLREIEDTPMEENEAPTS